MDALLGRVAPPQQSRPLPLSPGTGPLQDLQACFGTAAWASEALDVGRVAQAAGMNSPSVAQQAALIAIREMVCSVTLADPSLPDCPLIGCSDGFEALTGYMRAEIVGQNCRFLNRGLCMHAALRAKLREASFNGAEFIGVVPNMRKNGKRFQNLLHMTTLTVKEKRYIVGIQADASHISIDPRNSGHRDALRAAAERVFAGNIDAWIQMQAREFSIRLPAPYSQLLKLGAPGRFMQEMNNLVKVGCASQAPSSEGEEAGKRLRHHACDVEMETRSTTVGTAPAHTGDERGLHKLEAASTTYSSRALCASGRGEAKEANSKGDPAEGVPIKSLGSVGHPHECVECCFHFFGPSGCRAAADCDFCHEFHPRKNAKKNRRLIKRLANSSPCSEQQARLAASNSAEEGTSPTEVTRPQQMVAAAPPKHQDADLVVEVCNDSLAVQGSGISDPNPECTLPDVAESAGAAKGHGSTSPDSFGTIGREMVRVSYGEPSHSSAHETATLVSGVNTRLPPKLRFASAVSKESLESCLTFVVEPALPAGLALDLRAGEISGVPQHAQPPRAYEVTVKTVALGPGGIPLGEVPLARCTLEISVVALSQLTLCSTREEGDRSAGGRLVLAFKA